MMRLAWESWRIMFVVALGATGCDSPKNLPKEPSPSASASVSVPEQVDSSGSVVEELEPEEQPKRAKNSAEQGRMFIVVVPGDAEVEVDGVKVRRRNGLIELAGDVGDVSRVRAFWGARTTKEEMVTIEAKGIYSKIIDATKGETVEPNGLKSSRTKVDINE